MRWGDNFFYDLGGEERPWRFRLAQLTQLGRASWARVLCDTVPTISVIQPDAFRAQSEDNQLTSCSQLPEVDLEPWREEPEADDPADGDGEAGGKEEEGEPKVGVPETNELDAGFLESLGL